MKHLLKMSDLTPQELMHLLDVADELKADRKAGRAHPLLTGKTLALIFAGHSTRTRTSFQVGMYQLGGMADYLNAETELQLGRGEDVADTARTLGRYYDGILVRTANHKDAEALAKWSGVPVINGLTDYAHPCQVVADLMTIREKLGGFEGRKLCFIGDGNGMANSLITGGLMAGMDVTMVCPEGCEPGPSVLRWARNYCERFVLSYDPVAGVKDADVVYTDAWLSGAGGESEKMLRRKFFRGYQVNRTLLEGAKSDCMVLHCLPARKGEEITADVFEAHAAEIFEQTENRLHAEKAILAVLLGGK